MPCLPLRKCFFAIKTWKSFTTKILQKLHPYKIIKITKARSPRTKTIRPRAQPPMYYPTLYKRSKYRHSAKNRRQIFGSSKASLHRPKHLCGFKKRSLAAPPPVFVDKLFWTQPRDVVSGGLTGKPRPVMRSEVVVPQLRGIDARAEEFIARFRAELEYQETEAHGL